MKKPSMPIISPTDETPGRLRVFRQPPDGFDPLKATKRQLTAYGLPHLPDKKIHPKQAALWRQYMADRPRYVLPKLRIDRSLRRKGGHRGAAGMGGTAPPDLPLYGFDKRLAIRNLSPQTTDVWSGAYVDRPSTEPFNNVFASFNVPYVQPPTSAWNGNGWNDGFYSAYTWIGLDGWNGPDVVQAGVAGDVKVTNGSVSTSYYVWVEFYPGGLHSVENFPVAPGDMLALIVCSPFTATHAVAFFSNKTSGQAVPFGFDALGSTVGTGVRAEWIVENPLIGPNRFANYGSITFHDCLAASATQEHDLLSATPINMAKSDGAVISTGWLETPSQLRCTYR